MKTRPPCKQHTDTRFVRDFTRYLGASDGVAARENGEYLNFQCRVCGETFALPREFFRTKKNEPVDFSTGSS